MQHSTLLTKNTQIIVSNRKNIYNFLTTIPQTVISNSKKKIVLYPPSHQMNNTPKTPKIKRKQHKREAKTYLDLILELHNLVREREPRRVRALGGGRSGDGVATADEGLNRRRRIFPLDRLPRLEPRYLPVPPVPLLRHIRPPRPSPEPYARIKAPRGGAGARLVDRRSGIGEGEKWRIIWKGEARVLPPSRLKSDTRGGFGLHMFLRVGSSE